jgi:hypothetical protein
MYPMSLAQVWMHSIEFSFQTPICNLFEFFITIHTHQNFNNIVHILGFKITKSTLLNQTWWGLSNNTKNAPKFQYSFQSWFFKNSMKNWFNDQ